MMKHILFLVTAMLMVGQPLFCQQKEGTYSYYMQKSKRQKTTGIILFAGGTALVITGIVLGSNNTDASDLDQGPNFDEGMWLVIPGVALELASIPLFISAANNRRKAASLSLGIWKPESPFFARQQHRPRGAAITLRLTL